MGSSCLDLGYCMCLNNEYTGASGGCLGASGGLYGDRYGQGSTGIPAKSRSRSKLAYLPGSRSRSKS